MLMSGVTDEGQSHWLRILHVRGQVSMMMNLPPSVRHGFLITFISRMLISNRYLRCTFQILGVSGLADRGGGDNSIQFINFGRVGDKMF